MLKSHSYGDDLEHNITSLNALLVDQSIGSDK